MKFGGSEERQKFIKEKTQGVSGIEKTKKLFNAFREYRQNKKNQTTNLKKIILDVADKICKTTVMDNEEREDINKYYETLKGDERSLYYLSAVVRTRLRNLADIVCWTDDGIEKTYQLSTNGKVLNGKTNKKTVFRDDSLGFMWGICNIIDEIDNMYCKKTPSEILDFIVSSLQSRITELRKVRRANPKLNPYAPVYRYEEVVLSLKKLSDAFQNTVSFINTNIKQINSGTLGTYGAEENYTGWSLED